MPHYVFKYIPITTVGQE